MSLKVTTHPESGLITQVQTNTGIFSYTYLASPRPESSMINPGKYGTEFVIQDEETLSALKKYLNEKLTEGIANEWGGKLPKNVHLPLRKGDEDNELEQGKWVLKTDSKFQPALFILDNQSGRAYEVQSEDELDEIYSGMEGEIIVRFKPYTIKELGKYGIKCYINAACKTGDGTPLGMKNDFVAAFSTTTDFDTDEQTSNKNPVNKSKKEEASQAAVSLDDLLGSKNEAKTTSKTTSKTGSKTTAKSEEPQEALSLDDLLK